MSKIIWVVGSPRSGTSYLTEYLGEYTDYCFCEPWERFPIEEYKSWDFPKDGTIVFKYCANSLRHKEISALFPKSLWIHMVRKPIHVLYSMFWPKENSYPKRLWEDMGNEPEERVHNVFKKWKTITDASYGIKDAKIVNYEKIDIQEISDFVGINLDVEKFHFSNRNEVYDQKKMDCLIDLLVKHNLIKDVIL